MGINAIATVGLGRKVEAGEELPWGYVHDIEDWWLKETGYQPHQSPFTESGNWLESIAVNDRDAAYAVYSAHKKQWEKDHPCPVELFICGSTDGDYETVVAVPGTIVTATWEGCESLDLSTMQRGVDPSKADAAYRFCEKYNIEGAQGWWLGASLS